MLEKIQCAILPQDRVFPVIYTLCRALGKGEYKMIIFSHFSLKPYVVTPHLNRLIETVQMRGHNIYGFNEK